MILNDDKEIIATFVDIARRRPTGLCAVPQSRMKLVVSQPG